MMRPVWTSMMFVACIAGSAACADPAAELVRTVRYGFHVENRSGLRVTNAQLWAYAPLARTSHQERHSLEVSVPHALHRDALGHTIVAMPLAPLAPYAQRIVTIEATVAMSPEPAALPADGPWLRAEPLMNWEDRAFARRGPARVGGAPEARAQRLFAWTADALRDVGYLSADRGAVHALRTRTGDCTEYACLFAALCRRDAVPARVLGGYLVRRNELLHPIGYHNWAEFHDGTRWRVADPDRRVFDAQGEIYVAFRILGEVENALHGHAQFRFAGDGVHVSMLTWGDG